MIKSICLLLFIVISAVSIQAQNDARLDSIRSTSKLNPDSNPSFTGTDFIYDGNELKETINIRITNGVRQISSYTKYNEDYGYYQRCSEVYFGGNLNRYSCTFDTIINGKKGLCTKTFQLEGQSYNLDLFYINFKSFDNNENLLVDSTLNFKSEDMTLDDTYVLCYSYDSNNNVIELIRKTIEGTTTFYGDLTEHAITYDGQGRKEKEIIKWTYFLILRTIDSLAFTYEDDKIIEHKYNLLIGDPSQKKDLIITTRDKRGLVNIKEFKTNQFNGELFMSRNLDYYYSGPSSTIETKYNLQSLYPNPSSQFINIDTQITSAAIVNINGQRVIDFQQPINGQIDVSVLPAGIYLLEPIVGNIKLAPYKFVKY